MSYLRPFQLVFSLVLLILSVGSKLEAQFDNFKGPFPLDRPRQFLSHSLNHTKNNPKIPLSSSVSVRNGMLGNFEVPNKPVFTQPRSSSGNAVFPSNANELGAKLENFNSNLSIPTDPKTKALEGPFKNNNLSFLNVNSPLNSHGPSSSPLRPQASTPNTGAGDFEGESPRPLQPDKPEFRDPPLDLIHNLPDSDFHSAAPGNGGDNPSTQFNFVGGGKCQMTMIQEENGMCIAASAAHCTITSRSYYDEAEKSFISQADLNIEGYGRVSAKMYYSPQWGGGDRQTVGDVGAIVFNCPTATGLPVIPIAEKPVWENEPLFYGLRVTNHGFWSAQAGTIWGSNGKSLKTIINPLSGQPFSTAGDSGSGLFRVDEEGNKELVGIHHGFLNYALDLSFLKHVISLHNASQ